MEIGDIVCRKKYGKDIFFEIIDIKEEIYYLRGIEFRLIADSEESDLELVDMELKEQEIEIEEKHYLKGKVLHIDGDKHYLDTCMKQYKKCGIQANGYFMKEEEIKEKIIPLLQKHKPNILVITGHDALKRKSDLRDIKSYLHSKDYVEAIKLAREYESNKDHLVIFAGACQSYYELLLASGANFASSPERKNIHALDPVFVASQVASASVKNYLDLEKIVDKTSNKQQGIGGIDTRGVARQIYPTGR